MKRIIFILPAFFLTTIMVYSQNPVKTENKNETAKPGIEFTELRHDFEKIEYNGDGSCEFEFTNNGKDLLILSNVTSTCGCTAPKWTRAPIQPGEKGKISVKYDTRRVGPFTKSVRVYSNATDTPVTLTITGTVEKPQNQ
ncbi:MAG: DUF1573 domain-containing protein [Bacteroidales bacterium]